jgi:hypothetical protein
MSANAHRNVARAAGALLGICLAVALLLVSRPDAAGAPLPASVRIAVAPVGELEIAPAPPRAALVANALRPGGRPARGAFTARNQTGEDLTVVLQADADSTALNGLLGVRVGAGNGPVEQTTLEGLRLHPIRLRLDSGQRTRLRLEAWLPAEVLSGYEGRQVEVTLTPVLHAEEGAG